mgnify:CR=1 FL=1
MTLTACDHDMLIVGAGISGIGMAAHLSMKCPDRSYVIVERRDQVWMGFLAPALVAFSIFSRR